jgi:tetratricopeptide (TPR) repeat protein
VTVKQIAHDRNSGHPAPRPAAAIAPRANPAGRLAAATGERPGDLIRRAYIELHKGDARKASDLATQALRLDPSGASGYIALAGARDALGDRGGALAAFRDCARYAQDKLVGACKTLAH